MHDTINSGFLTRTLKSNVGTCRHRTISGECCVPFIYRRRRYNGCARHRSGRKWCYITPDYRRNRLWGWCRGGTRCKAFLSSIVFLFFVFILFFVFCFFLLARRTLCRISFTQLPLAKKTLDLYDNRIKQYLMYLQKLKEMIKSKGDWPVWIWFRTESVRTYFILQLKAFLSLISIVIWLYLNVLLQLHQSRLQLELEVSIRLVCCPSSVESKKALIEGRVFKYTSLSQGLFIDTYTFS